MLSTCYLVISGSSRELGPRRGVFGLSVTAPKSVLDRLEGHLRDRQYLLASFVTDTYGVNATRVLRTTTYTYISTDTRFQPNFLLSRTRWVVLDEGNHCGTYQT